MFNWKTKKQRIRELEHKVRWLETHRVPLPPSVTNKPYTDPWMDSDHILYQIVEILGLKYEMVNYDTGRLVKPKEETKSDKLGDTPTAQRSISVTLEKS